MAEDTRDLDATKASMDPYTLNNMVTKLRPVVKKVRLRVIQKLVKSAKACKQKRASDLQKSKNNRKAAKLVQEILEIKKVNIDFVTKFALANTTSWGDISKKGDSVSVQTRALTRMSCHDLLQTHVKKWRLEHEDWKSLSAFLLSKGTGRRIKRKKSSAKKGDAESVKQKAKKLVESISNAKDSFQDKSSAKVAETSEAAQSNAANVVKKTSVKKVHLLDPQSKKTVSFTKYSSSEALNEMDYSSNDESLSEEDDNFTDSDLSSDDSVKELPIKTNIELKQSSGKAKVYSEEHTFKTPNGSKKREPVSEPFIDINSGDMVVRKLTIQDLENLDKLTFRPNRPSKKKEDVSFLFAKESEKSVSNADEKRTRRKDAFFAHSDNSDESEADSELQVDDGVEYDSATDEEDAEEMKRMASFNGKKSMQSTFLGTLSQVEVRKASRPEDNGSKTAKFQKSTRWPEKSKHTSSLSHSAAPQRKKFCLAKPVDNKYGGKSLDHRGFGKKGQMKPADITKGKTMLPDNLHPSWEASRKRKEQTKKIFQPYQGKKIKFDDD